MKIGKIGGFLVGLVVWQFFAPREAWGVGTCQCTMNASRSLFVIEDKNQCDADVEYAECDLNVGYPDFCKCLSLDTKEPNSCECGGYNKCDAGLRPFCESRSMTCLCLDEETYKQVTGKKSPSYAENKFYIYCGVGGSAAAEPADLKNPEIFTALGCIPVKTRGFVTWLMPYLFGIAGGVSFLMMVMGFISIATSGGDPKAVAEASGKITSAITGLLVSIFAIFILRLIAVDILKIPGFN